MATIHELSPAMHREAQAPASAQPPQSAPDMPASVHMFIAQADEATHALLPAFHAKVEGLAEGIHQINGQMHHVAREAQVAQARWDLFADARTHWTFIRPWLVWVLLATLLVSETALAATVMAGLDLTDTERYLVALGTVAGSTFVVKALAYAWRRRADDARDRFELNPKEMAVVWMGLLALVLVLAGQVLARESFAAQAHAGDTTGVSWKVALALTLLQAGLYLAVGVGLFKLLPHVRGHEAERQYRAALKVLHRLHGQRQALAARLNRHVMTLRADWEKVHAVHRFGIYEHLAELAHLRSDKLPAFYLDERLFKPVPAWVWPVVDPMPDLVQQMVEQGALAGDAMQERRRHLEGTLLHRQVKEQPAAGKLPPAGPASVAVQPVDQTPAAAESIPVATQPDAATPTA